MSISRLVQLTETMLSLEAQLSNGRTGATGLVAVREANTSNSWLDFDDNTFKTIGWGTRQQALVQVSAANAPGLYRLVVNVATMIPTRVAGDELIAEFDVSATSPALQVFGIDRFLLVSSLHDLATAAAVALLETEASAATREATNTAEHTTTLTAVGLNENEASALARATADAAAHVVTQGRLPAALVGGRMDSDVGNMQTDTVDANALATDAAQEIATVLETTGTNPHGTGAWTGSILSQQNIRDAMKLAPTVGVPAAGSVDEHLDTIEADTAAIEPLVTVNLDAMVSSRESEASASGRAVTTATAHAALSTEHTTLAVGIAAGETEVAAAGREVTNTAEHAATLAAVGLNETEVAAAARAATDQAEHDATQVAVALVETEASAAARQVTDLIEHDATQAAIAALPVPPSVGAIADQVWDEHSPDHLIPSSTGAILAAFEQQVLVHQGWVDDPAGAGTMKVEVQLHLNGEFTLGVAGDTLDLELFEEGVSVFSIALVAPDANGQYRTSVPGATYRPTEGKNLVSVAVVRLAAGGVYTSAIVIPVPKFL